MTFPYEAVVAGGKDVGYVVYHDAYRYLPSGNNWLVIPDYPGGSGWSGTSFGIGTRTFGGLGKELLPSNQFFNDFWALVMVNDVSLDEIESSTKDVLRVVPNPAAAGENIQVVLQPQFNGTGKVSVSDAAGRIVFQGTASKSFALPSLSTGMYELSFQSRTDEVFRGRFIVQ